MAPPDQREFLKRFTTRNEYNRLSVTERSVLTGEYMRAQAALAQSEDSETNHQLLRRFLISHADPYVAISESHFSKDDSEAVKVASMAFYELTDEKY